nr:hypothetical protein CFP56_44300 [Quercus suber]
MDVMFAQFKSQDGTREDLALSFNPLWTSGYHDRPAKTKSPRPIAGFLLTESEHDQVGHVRLGGFNERVEFKSWTTPVRNESEEKVVPVQEWSGLRGRQQEAAAGPKTTEDHPSWRANDRQ